MAEPARLKVFAQKLMAVREERSSSGVGGGLSDLIESAAKVKKRQDAMQTASPRHVNGAAQGFEASQVFVAREMRRRLT